MHRVKSDRRLESYIGNSDDSYNKMLRPILFLAAIVSVIGGGLMRSAVHDYLNKSHGVKFFNATPPRPARGRTVVRGRGGSYQPLH